MPRERVGILGGMFDPVHNGHLQVVQQLKSHLKLDRVLLIPCGVPVHKRGSHASNDSRCAMLELAAADCDWLAVDRREVDSEAPSWSFNTLNALRTELPASTLYFVMGADAFLSLPSWYRWEELPAVAHLVVSTRPGYSIDVEALAEPLAEFCRRHAVQHPDDMLREPAGCLYFAPLDTALLSSTAVREQIRQGECLDDVLPPRVAAYIAEQQLYL